MADTAAARLVAKLRDLDLADDEAALLGEVFRLAAEAGGPEVEGYGPVIDQMGAKGPFPGPKLEFKGSDEELQAIIDWLGSLEAQK